jgi:hypothetical protein
MPNWCANKVTFKHSDPKQLHKLVRAWNSGCLMGTFLPCPAELKATIAGCVGPAGSAAQLALEAQEQQNIELYGAKNWYDWQVGHWGTKWDVGRETDQTPKRVSPSAKHITLVFDSAWSPPIQFFEHLRAVEGFNITAYCFEPGVGFCGIYRDGVIEEFDVPTKQNELEKLPKRLVQAFAMNEWVTNELESEAEEEE